MSRNFIFGLVCGAVVGAGLGLVYAPKSGSDVREGLTSMGKKAADGVKRSASRLARHADKEELVKQAI